MFWSEIGSGLRELGGKPVPRIPSSTSLPPGAPPLGKRWEIDSLFDFF